MKIKSFVFMMLCLITTMAYSQSKIELGADLYSRYILKGYDLGANNPSLQPFLKYSYMTENSSITVGTFGAYALSNNSQEVDLFVNYTYRSISLQVTDYYFPDYYTGERNKYFNYNQDSTGHTFEVAIGYKSTKIPFTILASANVYGNDALDKDGNILYTKYVELGYYNKLDNIDYNIFVGALLDNPGTVGFYGNTKAGVCNIGIKAIKYCEFKNYTLPLHVQFITNPEASKAYLVFGISF